MNYEKQEFKNGQVLTAECLNRMEEGIKGACEAVPPKCDSADCSKVLSYGRKGFEWINIPDGGGGGGSAVAPLIVTIQEDEKASHTALQIYDQVQAGGEVFLNINIGYPDSISLIKLATVDYVRGDEGQEWGYAEFRGSSDDNFFFGYAVDHEGTVSNYENHLVDHSYFEYWVRDNFRPITQDEYDALVAAGEVDESVYYMIVG